MFIQKTQGVFTSFNKKQKRIFNLAIAGFFILMQLLLSVQPILAEHKDTHNPNNNNDEEKVRICHANNSVTNRYNSINVSPSAVDGEGANDHTSHTGPVAVDQASAQALKDAKTPWGDIIPEIDGVSDGLNWTAEGEEIWNNNCGDEVIDIEDCEAGPGYASFVEDFLLGTKKNSDPITGPRSEAEHSLGSPDATTGPDDGFFSLGADGWIVVGFNGYVTNEDGVDLSFHEVTNGRSTYPEEVIDVEVSQDGSDWYAIGSVTNKDGGDGVGYLDFDSTELDWIKYVRISEATDFGPHATSADGYDLDAVDATNIVCDEPEPRDVATVLAHKIVCRNEESLPNWGASGGPDIGEGFAEDWVAEQEEDCRLVEDWSFEWKTAGGTANPGDSTVGPVGEPWNEFTADGYTAEAKIPAEDVSLLQMREVLPEGYIPFSGDNKDNVSAEFYCATDVGNYDNWEWIRNPQVGATYYCVAWNVRDVQDFTIHASKVICDTETALPNWGGGGADITENTAQNWVDQSEGHCWLARWDFQWAVNTSNPGDHIGEAGEPWTTFSSSTAISPTDLEEDDNIWVREVFDDDYIGFTGVNRTQDVSAELYCNKDVLNYDNFDFIRNPEEGEDYYCVGFNVLKPAVINTVKIVCDLEEYLPNWGNGQTGPDMITAETADDWLAQDENSRHCQKVDWRFQWVSADDDNTNPGDQTPVAPVPWQSFSESADIDIATLGENNKVWLREVFNPDYIPFAGQTNQDSVSAEIYCGTDVLNYDNWEFITNLTPGQEYYCVAWNVHVDAGVIQGRKFHDRNANGVFDRDERRAEGNLNRLDGWTINLYDDEWNLVDSMETGDDTTDAGNVAKGQYRFEGLGVGTYYVCEVGQEGWVQTQPSSGPQNEDGLFCRTVNINHPTQRRTGRSFGNYESIGQIQGLVYNDLNQNSNQDEGEPGLNGWDVWLLTHNSPYTIYEIQTTDNSGSGAFLFDNLPFGTYFVCQDIQEGWIQSQLNNAGSGGVDSSSPTAGDVLELDDAEVAEFCYEVEITPENPTATERDFGDYFAVLGTTDTIKPGLVLGATDTGNVLAETGNPIIHAAMTGLLLIVATTIMTALTRSKSS